MILSLSPWPLSSLHPSIPYFASCLSTVQSSLCVVIYEPRVWLEETQMRAHAHCQLVSRSRPALLRLHLTNSLISITLIPLPKCYKSNMGCNLSIILNTERERERGRCEFAKEQREEKIKKNWVKELNSKSYGLITGNISACAHLKDALLKMCTEEPTVVHLRKLTMVLL